MISPLFVEEKRLKLVAGVHVTKDTCVLFAAGHAKDRPSGVRAVDIAFGSLDVPAAQTAKARDLRELAELFAKMADALEQT